MHKKLWAAFALLIIVALTLAACGGASGPVTAVESYLKAVTSKDSAKVSALACKAYEAQALLEMDGFQAVKAELVNLSCKETGTEAGATLVNCTGSIALTYNTEKQSLDLSRQSYKLVQEGGDWRVCGVK